MARPSDPRAKIDLLRAAEIAFIDHGLDRTKVEEITERAGRSKGAFYLHFDSKEEAFRQIVETMLARLAMCIDAEQIALASNASSDVSDYLERWRDKDLAVFEFVWQNRGVMRLLLGGGKSAGFAYLIDEFAERSRASIEEALHRGVAMGVFRANLDVAVASLVIAGAYDRVARQLVLFEKKPDLRRWLRDVQQLVLVGVAASDLSAMLGPTVNKSAIPIQKKLSERPTANKKRATYNRSAAKSIEAVNTHRRGKKIDGKR